MERISPVLGLSSRIGAIRALLVNSFGIPGSKWSRVPAGVHLVHLRCHLPIKQSTVDLPQLLFVTHVVFEEPKAGDHDDLTGL